jgi:ribosomal protein L37AE/L43A
MLMVPAAPVNAMPPPPPVAPQAAPWPQPGPAPQSQAAPPPGQSPQTPTCPRCASVGVWYPQAGIWGCERCRAPIGAPAPRAAVEKPSGLGNGVIKFFGIVILIIVLVAIKLGLRGAFR